jgi:dTDP-4-dehydrorhamnose reductase
VKTLIFGPGYLGTLLATALPGATLSRVNILDRDAVRGELRTHGATHVVNCAGKTGRPNVDWCEDHQVETYRGNVEGPLALAEVCAGENAYLLHMGSGCIFYGDAPTSGGWREDDFANPTSFYSRTKYAADLVLSRLPHVGIARLRMPIGDRPDPRNLITKLAGYKRIVDVENSVSVVSDLIDVTRQLLEKRATGIFHATNPGTMKHRDLIRLYQELVDPSHRPEFISEDELLGSGLVKKGRSNCILASPRLAELGIHMRPVEEALRATMTAYVHAKRSS